MTASCQTFNGFSYKRGCLTASSFCGYFISLLYGLEAGCKTITLTRICGTQGALITICCLQFTMITTLCRTLLPLVCFLSRTQAFYITFYHFMLTLAIINNHFFMTSCATSTFCIFCLITSAEKNPTYPLYITRG